MYIVLGASRGIGFEVVKKLLGQNDKVYALSRNIAPLKELQATHPHLSVEALDISNEAEVIGWVNQFIDWKSLQGILYCAGTLLNKPFSEIEMADWEQVYNTNVFGPAVFCGQVQLKVSTQQKLHHVFIGSMGGFQGASKFPGLSAYSSSKAALSCMAECLAEEFKEGNASFNSLSLGAVQTQMLEEAFPGYAAPLEAGEMAEFILSFLKTGNQFFNGQNLPVRLSNP